MCEYVMSKQAAVTLHVQTVACQKGNFTTPSTFHTIIHFYCTNNKQAITLLASSSIFMLAT